MIYSTGTIAINGNTVTGTGTNFTGANSLIRNGCTLISTSNPVQIFQITSINSSTQLTVIPSASPDITAGTRYSILLSDNLSVDGLALNVAETLGMYQRNISGFADVMNSTGDVTITVNNQPLTVPGQKSLVKKSELTDTAKRNLYNSFYGGESESAGVALQTNADFRPVLGYDGFDSFPPGVMCGIQDGSKYGGAGYVSLLSCRGWPDTSAPDASFQIAVNSSLQIFRIPYRSSDGNYYFANYKIWNQKNTTVDSSGFIKQASPILRLTANAKEMTPGFIDGFEISGSGAVNDEAKGASAERTDVGVYEIKGSLGLHEDGWQIEGPRDINGNRLCFIEVETKKDNAIIVRTYKPQLDLDTGGIKAGEAIDIPAGRWIDLRLKMPVQTAI